MCRSKFGLAILDAVAAALAAPQQADARGSRGGAGYREASGRCAASR